MGDFESGIKRKSRLVMSSAQSSGYVVFDTIVSMGFNMLLFMLVASAAAFFFNIPAVVQTARTQNIALRRVHNASLNTPTCGLYFNQLSKEEEARARAGDAHLIDTEFCNVARAYIDEAHEIQVIRRMFNHYSLCEAGRCDEFLKTVANNGMWIALGSICMFLLFSFMFGRRTPSLNEQMLQFQMMQGQMAMEHKQIKHLHYE